MKRISKISIALAALALAGWYGIHSLGGDENFAIGPQIFGRAQMDLPDTPEEWQGRIDYAALDRQFADLTSRPEMAGMAVAIIENGKLSFVGSYGVADRSTGAAVTPDTVFRWASVSKTVAGTLAARLASEASLDLERPVASWETSLRLPQGAETRVTLAQLLSHRTGLTKNAYDEKLEEGESPAAIRGRLADAPLQCEPGTCHTYQNIAFDAASEILQQAADRPYADLVSERFFLPLGMKSASFGMAGLTGSKNWARPYRGSQPWAIKESFWRTPAAAGVQSNIVDFARWLQATMGERPDVLSAKVLGLAQMPRVKTARLYGGDLRQEIEDPHYGLGWRSFTYAGHGFIGHSGAVDGFRTTLIFEPETRNGVVVMWNSIWGRPFRVPFAVFDSFYKRADSDWLDLDELPPAEAEPSTAPEEAE